MYCFVGQSAPQGWEKVTSRKSGLSHSNRIKGASYLAKAGAKECRGEKKSTTAFSHLSPPAAWGPLAPLVRPAYPLTLS